MSFPSDENPYAAGSSIERSEPAWTDGELEFTDKEIRVPGNTELPQLCIHLGVDCDLVRREQTLRALPNSARRIQTICIVLLCLPVAAISWIPQLNSLVQPRWQTLLVLNAIAIVPFITARKVRVSWYVCRSYASPKEKWRKVFLPLMPGFVGMGPADGLFDGELEVDSCTRPRVPGRYLSGKRKNDWCSFPWKRSFYSARTFCRLY